MLADQHGNVVVVSTRDCSLQRRHQKLVEEAPAPFLTERAERSELYDASKAICKEAGYYGAGTCEFLVGDDGTISFLEVNTRLQVEHPVTEEVTGIDLVREQFRIANGEALGFDDPPLRGHSFEFRINGEDPGRGFLPAPGVLHRVEPAVGPGRAPRRRLRAGDVIGGNFDSLLAKLIVTGATREEALERSRRALDEFEVEGIATALPFHRAVVRDPAFATDDATPFTRAHPLDRDRVRQPDPGRTPAPRPTSTEPEERQTLVVEVGGKRARGRRCPAASRFGGGGAPPARRRRPKRSAQEVRQRGVRRRGHGADAGHDRQGRGRGGPAVAAGDLVVVLEAMKMEQPLTAHKAGTVTGLAAEVGRHRPQRHRAAGDQGLTAARSARRERPPARERSGGVAASWMGEDGPMSTRRSTAARLVAAAALTRRGRPSRALAPAGADHHVHRARRRSPRPARRRVGLRRPRRRRPDDHRRGRPAARADPRQRPAFFVAVLPRSAAVGGSSDATLQALYEGVGIRARTPSTSATRPSPPSRATPRSPVRLVATVAYRDNKDAGAYAVISAFVADATPVLTGTAGSGGSSEGSSGGGFGILAFLAVVAAAIGGGGFWLAARPRRPTPSSTAAIQRMVDEDVTSYGEVVARSTSTTRASTRAAAPTRSARSTPTRRPRAAPA